MFLKVTCLRSCRKGLKRPLGEEVSARRLQAYAMNLSRLQVQGCNQEGDLHHLLLHHHHHHLRIQQVVSIPNILSSFSFIPSASSQSPSGQMSPPSGSRAHFPVSPSMVAPTLSASLPLLPFWPFPFGPMPRLPSFPSTVAQFTVSSALPTFPFWPSPLGQMAHLPGKYLG